MWLPPSKVSLHKRCGPVCTAEARVRLKEKRKRSCETCGDVFYPRGSQIRDGNGRFCSQKCNTAKLAALADPVFKAKQSARLRAAHASGLIKHRKGPDNPNWKGGKGAMIERQKPWRKVWLRAYRLKHPEVALNNKSRRRIRIGGQRLPRGTIIGIVKAQKQRCAICRTSIRKSYHVDHITALSKGGEHKPSNIQLLCRSCNVRKSAKDPIDYMQSLGRLL